MDPFINRFYLLKPFIAHISQKWFLLIVTKNRERSVHLLRCKCWKYCAGPDALFLLGKLKFYPGRKRNPENILSRVSPVWDSNVALGEEVTFEPKGRELVKAKTWKSDPSRGASGCQALRQA